MTQLRPRWAILPTFLALLILPSCRSSERSASDSKKQTPDSSTSSSGSTPVTAGSAKDTTAAPEANAAESKPFKLGDLIEPFTPPSLAELDKTAQWTDSPVVDAMERLREAKKKEPPLVTVQQALAMKNDSPDANRRILSALSVLAAP